MEDAIIKQLPVELTKEELAIKSEELAKTLKEIQAKETDKKLSAAAFKKEIDDLKADASDLVQIVHTKTENRPVKCEEDFDYERGIVITRRCDTGKQVETRPMTNSEKQLSFKSMRAGK